MKIIRRSGVEDDFNPQKIEEAIRKANNSVPLVDRLNEKYISRIVEASRIIAQILSGTCAFSLSLSGAMRNMILWKSVKI